MSHVLICGAAGFTNLGDDAILWGMLTQLRGVLGQRSLRVVGGPELAPLTRPFDAIPMSYDDREDLSRAVEEADLVILGGGGMLYDIGYHATLARFLTDPPDRQWLYELARLAAAARVAGKPVMMYAVGLGPLLTETARLAARFTADQSKAITVRDQSSADLLAECGVAPTRVHLAADAAVAVEPGSAEIAERFLAGNEVASRPRPWVAVNLRPWYRFGRKESAEEDAMDRLRARAAELVRGIRERLGGTAVMLPFQRLHDDDRELAASVLAEAGEEGAGAIIVEPPLSPPDLLAALARFDLVVGMRMHMLLMALTAGVPFVSLAYGDKVGEVAKAAGLGDHVYPVDDLNVEGALDSCESLLTNREEACARLGKGRAELRKAVGISAELAKAVLESGRIPRPRRDVPPPGDARPPRGLRVAMQIRPDYREKPGGDVVQLEQLLPFLKAGGLTAELTSEESADLSQYDLVHTINLDRPEDPYRHCSHALEQGKPVVVSPVHTDMSEFLEWGNPEYWELPDAPDGLPQPRPAPPPDSVERRRRALVHQQRQAIIDWATVYLPNSRADAEYLHRAFGMDLSRTVVVPHGISEMFFAARPEPFVEKYGVRDFVVCGAARVEARKNQLALIAAMRGTGIPLVIIGQPNPEEYRQLCRRYADEEVLFIDAMPQAELASAFAAAKVHALVSWFEVPGLVSLEAGAAGCNTVSTDRGSPPEYLGDLAWFCNPREIESIRSAVLAAYEAPRSEALRERIREHYTWARAAERTLEGYQLALAIHDQEPPAERQATLVRAMRRHADWLARQTADREYELRQAYRRIHELEGHIKHLEDWGRRWEDQSRALEAELMRLRAEFEKVTSRRLYRWSESLARVGWSILRRLGVRP